MLADAGATLDRPRPVLELPADLQHRRVADLVGAVPT
jgi:hypothetical protein